MEIPQSKPIFCVSCIDKRFDALTTNYFESTEFRLNYYSGTTAGAGLPLGYKQYCTEIFKCNCSLDICTPCNPLNPDMELLERSLIRNIEIALTLDPIPEIYIINHQDCGAIKAFLSCSGYPETLGGNNPLEIKINGELLFFAKNYVNFRFPDIKVRLGLIDVNGTVADFNEKYQTWQVVYRGFGEDPRGLWFGL